MDRTELRADILKSRRLQTGGFFVHETRVTLSSAKRRQAAADNALFCED
ncbi:hypothetical protein GGR60_002897 [Xanthomonas arboricola]|nr:hypothetical protein [Xanthomonas euroxanthea]